MRLNALSQKKLFAVILPAVFLLLLFGTKLGHSNPTRSGRYQFAYEEKGVTIRRKEGFLDLSANGRWVMDSPKFRKSQSSFRRIWTPPHGTYHINGDTITFQEIVSPGDYDGGPGRPSPIKVGRFQGKDIHIISFAHGIVSSQSAHNLRYEKQR